MKRLFIAVAIALACTSQAFGAASIVPAFSKWSSAGMAVDAGKQGTNTMQVIGATFSKPGGKPTMSINLPYRSVLSHGAKCDGTTDDTAAVEAANVYLDSIGGGKMIFPTGTCVMSSLKLRNKVIYEGMGESTVLKVKNGTNADFIYKNSNLVQGWALRNMTLDGNKASQTAGSGIYLYHADDGVGLTGDNDIRATLENLFVKDFKESGIEVSGAGSGSNGKYYNVRNLIIRNVQIRTCDGKGMDFFRLTDSKIEGTVSSSNQLSGMYFSYSGNIQMSNNKGFYNGVSDLSKGGLHIDNSKGFIVSNYEGQEEYGDGVSVNNSQDISFANLIVDANGFPSQTNRSGLSINNSKNIVGTVVARSMHANDATPFLQNIGVFLYGSTSDIENIGIVLTSTGQNTDTTHTLANGMQLNNVALTVNGQHRQYLTSASTNTVYDTTGAKLLDSNTYRSGNDSITKIDPAPVSNGQAQVDFFRDTNTSGNVQLRVFKGDDTATVSHYLQGGSAPNAYVAVNGGDYNNGHLVVGPNHLWVESATGKVRVKNGVPTTSNDGSVVGPATPEDIGAATAGVGTTSSIGGGALAAGACASGTVTVTGATTAMSVIASPVTYPGDGAYWRGYVSAANTVTVKVCGAIAMTPTASAYNVRVVH